ncbi:ATP-binding protein, partial [Lactiplantibacillus plantarum]|nr:ATP-binding protein [Lactiplantibacillus plantarum]MCH8635401.1 ATP-binding protein [Lactiplantibacillus plantarum]
EYSLDLADAFWRDRESKTVIVTTNLIGSDLTKRYGDRTLSRMKNHGVNNGITFANIPDHRGLVE